MTKRAWRRTAAVTLPLVAVLAGAAGTAFALARATASGSQPVGVIAAFGAQASTSASTASQSGPLVLTFAAGDVADRPFFVRNTGELALTGQSWTVAVANTSNGAKGSIDIVVCSGTYSGTRCSGTETPLFIGVTEGTTVTASTSYTVPVGGALSAKVVQSKKISGFSVTVGMAVSRAQTAPAARTTSS